MSDLLLDAVTSSEAGVLENLLELYSHDLSDVFPIDLGSDGRFGYPSLPLYWTEPDRRFPFFIKQGNRILGFVLIMVCPCHPERAERVEGPPGKCDAGPSTPLRVAWDDTANDHHVFDIAEFFVLRRYRRSGVGREAAFLAWDRFPSSWTVRVAERNAGALAFW